VERNTDARWRNHCCSGKATIFTYSECVSVALVTLHAKRMCRIIHYCHLWPNWFHHIFPHYFLNGAILGKNALSTKHVSWLPLQRLSETLLILIRTERDMIKKMYIGVHVKYTLFLSKFNQTNFLDRFSKNIQI
jgi:hypothetical protein